MHNFLPHSEETRNKILKDLNLNSIEDLFNNINSTIKLSKLNLPEGLSEFEALNKLQTLAKLNKTTNDFASFLGGGTYNRYSPACINAIIERAEFLTSYTPYQPEVSQGNLQAIYEYQTLICNLTGMDVSNASVYDGGTACAEAVLMASRITKKNKAIISDTLNPEYKKVVETYCYGSNIKIKYINFENFKTNIDELKKLCEEKDFGSVLIQTPNYFGCAEDMNTISEIAHTNGVKLIACVDPISLAVLKKPSEYDCDIVVGDLQPLGLPMSYGGPHCGFMTCKNQYSRQMPGRIVGRTLNKNGEQAFTLTLQTREQHIRRSKATSNICSNQALMTLAASIYLCLTGKEGLKEVTNLSIQRAHYLANKINQIKGFKILSNDFLYEFIIKIDEKISIKQFLKEFEKNQIFCGINLETKFASVKNCILTCITETNNIESIDKFIQTLQEISEKYELKEIKE